VNTKPFDIGDEAWQFEFGTDDSFKVISSTVIEIDSRGLVVTGKQGCFWNFTNSYHSKGEAVQAARDHCYAELRMAVSRHERRMRRIK
jgi:TPP-dependent trihydroxycyclohexane-1,2-dione (THcHDO) dehydratase